MLARALVVVAALSFVGMTTANAADETFDATKVVRVATKLLEAGHASHKPLSDELSEQWMESFLATLDPRKVYFLQCDIDEFRKWKRSLDNYAKTGDMRFAKYVRGRYQKRVAEAHTLAVAALNEQHDYTLDEVWPFPCEAHAASSKDLAERWRLRIKGELLFEKANRMPPAEARAFLRGRYDRIAKQARELNDERLCEIYLNALAVVYDPHSGYWSDETLSYLRGSKFRTLMSFLRLREDAGAILITGVAPVLDDGPARELLVGWELVAVQGGDGKVQHLVEMPSMEARRRLTYGYGNGDATIILELQHPVTMARKSVSWPRFPDR